MVNALFMLGSTYNKNRRLNILFALSWIAFMLIGANLNTGLVFVIVNIMAFGVVFGLGQLFKGKYSNKAIAIFSVLIWSIVIDVICFFLYPQFTMGQSLIGYISNGIAFNYRYMFINVVVVAAITIGVLLGKKIISTYRYLERRLLYGRTLKQEVVQMLMK